MNPLATLPRRSWPERISLSLAWGLIALGSLAFAGWLLEINLLIQPFPDFVPIRGSIALSLLIFGFALLSHEWFWPRGLWLVGLSGIFGLFHLLRHWFGWSLDFLPMDRGAPEHAIPVEFPAAVAFSLLLAAVALLLHHIRVPQRIYLPAKAVMGSIVVAMGVSILLGYAGNLPAVYMWGSAVPTSPVAAAGLMLLGSAVLLLAWRETMLVEDGPPRWSPVPVVIAGLTITLIFWVGLREREEAYQNARTQTAMETLAIQIGSELERQANGIERLTRKWSNDIPNKPVWEVDAGLQLRDTEALGCRSISWIHPNLRTRWVYPIEGNEDALAYDHSTDPARLAALEAARTTGKPVVSTTVGLSGLGGGFAIYAPIFYKGEIIGFTGAEFFNQKFFRTMVTDRLKLSSDYHIHVGVAGDMVFSTTLYPEQSHTDHLMLEKSYSIMDRRLRLSLQPTQESMARERRHLPEIALVAGLGFSLLLALSVQLARSARGGQRAAESSNRRLLAENEERRRVEARLKVSDERLRLALDSTHIGIFEWNVPANHAYYSPGLWSILGYDPNRMPATMEAWQSLVHPVDLAEYRRQLDLQLEGATTFIDPEYRLRANDGHWRWISTRAKTVASSDDGHPIRIIGTMQDITARREAEQALRASQAEARKLSLVAAKTDNPVLITSPDGKIEWVNESFCRVMEYTLEEAVGHNPVDFMTGPETDPHTIADIRNAMTLGQGHATDLVHYSKSGRKYHLHLEIQPVVNESGQIENFIAIETDITARVETEAQLRRAKAEADAASRAKSEFLASMSHEIRTPMNGVIGMTSLLMETPLTPEQRDFVNTIHTSGESLLAIINDILDFSKIESGKLELESIPFSLSTCLEDALDLFSLQASSKKIEFAYTLAPGVPAWINGDVTRLRQIVVNLVNNAVKFTPGGSIVIEVRPLPGAAGDEGIALEFAVRDTGIGIPPDRVNRLFKAFSQVDSSTTRKYGGTGLGLVICQRLSTLMGGSIRVESTVGKGSSFIFSIRTTAAPVPVEPAPAIPNRLLDGLVLIVEDNLAIQNQLRVLLESWGLFVAFTRTPAVARDFCTKLLQPPVLLIIDGDETSPGTSPLDELLDIRCARLLMLPFGQTAPAAPADGRPFGTIYKPIKGHTLLQTLIQLFSAPASAETGGTAKPKARLLVEDNAVNQKVALRFLERLGYEAVAANNGIEALRAIEARHYDLILMDLQMPEMDGFEATRQIRRHVPADYQPKIIALTANAMAGDRELCLAAGMDDYISKPVKMPELVEAIKRQFAMGYTSADETFAETSEAPPATGS
jgi:PAS domain S-box-containing protein